MTAGKVVHEVTLAVPPMVHIEARLALDGAMFGGFVPVTVAVKVMVLPTAGVALLTTYEAVYA